VEWVTFAIALGFCSLAVLAQSKRRGLRAVGLLCLFLVAAISTTVTLWLLWAAFLGPKVTQGIGNMGYLLMALPAAFIAAIADAFFVHTWRFDAKNATKRPGIEELKRMTKFFVHMSDTRDDK